jgi:hypothetical protein
MQCPCRNYVHRAHEKKKKKPLIPESTSKFNGSISFPKVAGIRPKITLHMGKLIVEVLRYIQLQAASMADWGVTN